MTVPGTASGDTVGTIIARASCTVSGRVFIAARITIFDQLPHIAVHVMKAKSVGQLAANRMRAAVRAEVVATIPAVVVQLAVIIAKAVIGVCAGPCCQSASKRDPLSACNRDPPVRPRRAVTSAPLAGVGA